jgi:hypothetical protein
MALAAPPLPPLRLQLVKPRSEPQRRDVGVAMGHILLALLERLHRVVKAEVHVHSTIAEGFPQYLVPYFKGELIEEGAVGGGRCC